MLRESGRTALVTAVVVAVTACADPTAVEDVREPMVPPVLYGTYWRDMEQCTSIRGRGMDQVKWFITDWFPGRPDLRGQWNDRHEITIHRDALLNQGVVTHEIVHELLGGDGAHRDFAWVHCQKWGLSMGTGH